MHLIVGLGNPGENYYDSRHNIGFLAVDLLADKIGVKLSRQGYSSLYNIGKINGNRVFLMKPQTYMNKSGIAVRHAMDFYKIDTKSIIVIHDEMDLPLERVKIKKNGGSAGHNGIKSIENQLGTNDFNRVRIGVGKPEYKDEGAKHVLSSFTRDERNKIDHILEKAVCAAEEIVNNGIDKAMNDFNVRQESDVENY